MCVTGAIRDFELDTGFSISTIDLDLVEASTHQSNRLHYELARVRIGVAT